MDLAIFRMNMRNNSGHAVYRADYVRRQVERKSSVNAPLNDDILNVIERIRQRIFVTGCEAFHSSSKAKNGKNTEYCTA